MQPQTTANNKTRSLWVAGGLFAGLLAILVLLFFLFRPSVSTGAKTVTLCVVDNTGGSVNYTVHTDEVYLRQVMEQAEGLTFSGWESEYGMEVEVVNGLRASYRENQAYWAFYVNDHYCAYGIDIQPVADGDAFRIVYTPA